MAKNTPSYLDFLSNPQADFEARADEKPAGAEPAPSGYYNLRIKKADYHPSSVGDGAGIKFEFEIADGRFSRRKIWQYVYIKPGTDLPEKMESRREAAQRGRALLVAISEACGHKGYAELDDLYDQEFCAYCVAFKDEYNGETRDKLRITSAKEYDKRLAKADRAPQRKVQRSGNDAPFSADIDDDDLPF